MKLKRSKIVWISVFFTIMVAFIVYLQGQFTYYDRRYVDSVTWYMTATQSLGSFYVFPAIIALMGSYMICRENHDDTLKSLLIIPVGVSDLIRAKLVITAVFSVVLYVAMFVATLTVEAILHISLLDLGTVFRLAKIYLLDGIGFFLAVSPVIAIMYKLKKGYWLAFIFAEVYSFLGLFFGSGNIMRSVYPITAVFCISGYYETTPVGFCVSLLSLLACGELAVLLLQRFNNRQRDRYIV